MLILEDLYLGDVRPSERSFKRNSQYGKALVRVLLQVTNCQLATLTSQGGTSTSALWPLQYSWLENPVGGGAW